MPTRVALRTRALAKAFGPTRALRSCSLELLSGEVHCIAGASRSGKSTLVKILAGVHRPDAGSIVLGGAEVRTLRSPARAMAAGIATVFQETLLVEPRSVLDNVWVGVDGARRTRIGAEEQRHRAAAVLGRLLRAAPALDEPVGCLSPVERQACCITRALVREPRILILDEATSALDTATRSRLFGLLRERVAAGTAAILVSHDAGEIAEIADRCTVIRSGETVATLDREATTHGALAQLMHARA